MSVARLFLTLFFIGSAVSNVLAEDTVDEAAAIEKIKQLGGTLHDATPQGLSVNIEPIPVLVIPFWAIVIPLTLLSAYLLLSKPRLVAMKTNPS
jgi:hypothetical protein